MAPEYEITVRITAPSREEAYLYARGITDKFENIEIAEPHKRLKRTEKPRYLHHKEMVTDFICSNEAQTINPRSIKLYMEENGIPRIKVGEIKTILEDLRNEGYKVPPYAPNHDKKAEEEVKPANNNETVEEISKPEPDPILKEKLIEDIGELWRVYHSVSKIQKNLDHRNNGIISVTEALQILESRKEIPSLKKAVKQRPLQLNLTPIENSLPADYTIIRKTLIE